MSLINDALKQVRQAQSPAADDPQPMPVLPPVVHHPVSAAGWLIPAVVIFLVVAGVFFVGWAVANHSVAHEKMTIAMSPAVAVDPTPAKIIPAPVAAAPVPAAAPVAVAPAPPVSPQAVLPKLQGIFYSPTAPAAIVDGKTVRPGDQLSQYHILEITKTTVTLAVAGGKAIKLTLDN